MSNVDLVYKAIQADKKIPSEVRKAGAFDAVVLVAKARNTKHAAAILNCFNRLLATDTVEQTQLKDIIEALAELAHTTQDIQVKVLQTLPLLLSSVSIPLSGSQLATCLKIPIGLLNVSGIVGSIASATLQQMLVSLFDNPPQSREADVSRIFQDLCSGFSGAQSDYLSFQPVKNTLVLELLESILAPKSRLFEAHPSLIDANLLSIITALIQDETTPHLLLIRALRLCSLLYTSKASLLASALEILPKANLTRQVLLLESIETAIQEIPSEQYPAIISILLLFEDSIPGLGTYSVCLPPKEADESFTVDGLIYTEIPNHTQGHEGVADWYRPPRKIISQMTVGDCPKVTPGYKSLLMFNILQTLSHQPEQIWRDTLILHSAFLSSCISIVLETALLSTISAVICKLDAVEDQKARDLYLRRLGRIAVSSSLQLVDPTAPPLGATGDLAHRSFSCLYMYLETITLLENSFNVRGWAQVLDILSTADQLLSLKSRRSNRQTPSIMGNVLSEEKPQAIDAHAASEMSRLNSRIANFFAASEAISDESFAALTEALCSMQAGVPGSPLTATPSASRVNSPHRRLGSVTSMTSFSLAFQPTSNPNTFPLEKLMELLPPNIPRFVRTKDSCGWEILLDFLKAEIHAGDTAAAEILGMTIVKAAHCGLQSEDQQKRFIDALESISGDGAIMLIQLETLASIIEILGHELLCGWNLILQILYSSITQGPASDAEVVRLGFSCLQLICTDFMSTLPSDQIALLIETIVGFASQKEALNIALSAVGHFWTVLGALPKHDLNTVYSRYPESMKKTSTPQTDDLLWLLLMENLVFMSQDVRPEVRNMAIQACFRTMNTADSLGNNLWLTSIHLLLRELQAIPASLAPESEGFLESVNLITSGCSKLVSSSLEQHGLTEHTAAVWKLVLGYLKSVSIATRVEAACFALNTMNEILTSTETVMRSDAFDLRMVNWQVVMTIGERLFDENLNSMTQEGIATYLQILKHLVEHEIGTNQTDDIAQILRICHQALIYPRSPTYYVDMDYLSGTQKPVAQILAYLLERHDGGHQQVFRALAKMLELAPAANKQDFDNDGSSAKLWKGTPSFVMFTVKLQEMIAKYYIADEDQTLEAMSYLIAALNKHIEQRFAKVSIANKSTTHNLWMSASSQILSFVQVLENRLDLPEGQKIWAQLLDTLSHLFQPHPHQSEEFVLATLNQLRALLIPRLGNQKPAFVHRYVEALYRGSWFYAQAEWIEPSTVASTYYDDQIIREWCFLELFKLAIQEKPQPHVNGSTETLRYPQNDRCAEATLPFAIRRVQNILHRYINNAELRGNAPLPRIEYAELLLLLDHLSDDTIQHANQKALLKSVYMLVVEALMVNQRDLKVLGLLKNTLMRVGDLL